LDHPALRDLQMPAILLFVPNGDHDPGWFPALHNGNDLIRFDLPEIRIEKLIAPAWRRFQDRSVPFF
jgi:hypothetical protein